LSDAALSLEATILKPVKKFRAVTFKCNAVPDKMIEKIKELDVRLGFLTEPLINNLPKETVMSKVGVNEDGSIDLEVDALAQLVDHDQTTTMNEIRRALSESLGQCQLTALR
jgi:hypothetical protein